jgi:methyl-accepting chemotaxis protein
MLKNLTIKARLALLVGFMAVMILIGGWIGMASLNSASKALQDLNEENVETSRFFNKVIQLYDESLVENLLNMNKQLISSEEGLHNINELKNTITTEWNKYIKRSLTPEQRRLVEQTQGLINTGNSSLDKLKSIIDGQDKTQLNEYINKDLYAFKNPIVLNLNKLNQMSDEQVAVQFQEAMDHFDSLKLTILITTLLVIIISILLGIAFAQSITQPLKKAVDAVNQFALGDTDVQLDYDSKDEIALLLHDLKNMIASNNKMIKVLASVADGDVSVSVEPRSEKDTLGFALNNMVKKMGEMIAVIAAVADGDLTVAVEPRSDKDILGHALENMVRKMGEMLGEIQKEMKTLRDNTQEIVASVTHASAGTSETAAAVTETTSTVEELKQTSTVAAEKADDVHKNSKDTMEIVTACEQSLNSTITDMNEIHTKMDIISECIIKLSEHSIAIGNIVDTVNDLAEQSNLLAVNAAIEAARVGEQGRGFGVVAQEIRVLAEQSKEATSQIRTILQDIQNATNNAVMATEQGAKAVAKGVSQSSQTNESMHALSNSFSEVALAATLISTSSQQQLAAIDQVTTAILQINEASIQHAETMQQIKSATINLNTIGESVDGLINQYQINKDQFQQKLQQQLNTIDRKELAKILDKYVEAKN